MEILSNISLLNDSAGLSNNLTAPEPAPVNMRDDAVWILSSSFIIFTMQSGFGLLESGSVSGKNEVNIMVKNVIDVVFGGFTFWSLGYGITFGKNSGALRSFMGWGRFFMDGDRHVEEDETVGWNYAKFFFQLSFSTTSATIVSGAMVERTRLVSYIFVCMFTILMQSFPAHWVWAEDGFLRKWGTVDVAGASAVHLVGGCVGFVSTVFLRPRLGRFDKGGRSEISSPTNALLGTFMLWWGWLGFNCGSTWGITNGKWQHAARSAVSTIMSSMGGGMIAIISSYVWTKKCKIDFLINGILASLVSITGICAYARPWYSLVIGAVGSLLAICVANLLELVHIDDPVGVIPVHLIGSTWGMIAVGLFAERPPNRHAEDPELDGLFFTGKWHLLSIQICTTLIIGVWSCVTSLICLMVLHYSPVGLRISKEEEEIGADFFEHDLSAHGFHGYGLQSTSQTRKASQTGSISTSTIAKLASIRWKGKVSISNQEAQEKFLRERSGASSTKMYSNGRHRLSLVPENPVTGRKRSLGSRRISASVSACHPDHIIQQQQQQQWLDENQDLDYNSYDTPTNESMSTIQEEEDPEKELENINSHSTELDLTNQETELEGSWKPRIAIISRNQPSNTPKFKPIKNDKSARKVRFGKSSHTRKSRNSADYYAAAATERNLSAASGIYTDWVQQHP